MSDRVGLSNAPDEDDLSELSKLVQQLVYESIVKVVVRAGGAERHQDGAVRRPLQGNDFLVDLVPRLRVDLQDVHVYYGNNGPKEKRGNIEDGGRSVKKKMYLIATLFSISTRSMRSRCGIRRKGSKSYS